MGNYSSFKLFAIIDKPYREYFSKLLSEEEETDCLSKYINFLYGSGGFFDVEKEYSKDTGILVCGHSLKNYGHFDNECYGSEVEFCINKAVLPFGEIIVFCLHDDDLHYECACDPTNEYNQASRLNEHKGYYVNKYKSIIKNVMHMSNLIDDNNSKFKKMKEFLKKDIKSILQRYIDYNFDLSELKKALENL